MTVTLFGTTLTIHFGLPFSWKILFVGAMAFLLANVVYAVFCPRIIRETADYREFVEQRRSGVELMNSLERAHHAGLIANIDADPLVQWFRARHASLTMQYVSTSGSPQPDDKVFPD